MGRVCNWKDVAICNKNSGYDSFELIAPTGIVTISVSG